MARVKNYQADMTAGVLDPLVAARVDTEIYKKGVEIGDNVVPLVQGGMRRRPGSRHIQALPRRAAPIGPNNVLGAQDDFGNTLVHFGLDGLADGVGNDIVSRVLNATPSPDGASTADRITFTGALNVPGIRHGIGTSQGVVSGLFDTRRAGTYTYGIWLRLFVATTQDITWTVTMGRRACFPQPVQLFEVPNCYEPATVSTTVDMNDTTTWHHLVVTLDKPLTDGLTLDIDISHDAGVGVNPEFVFWGNQFFVGDRIPRTLSNQGVGLNASSPTGAFINNIADYNAATTATTTSSLGTTSPFVVAQLNLIDHFNLAFVDVRGIQLVTGTGTAPDVVNEFRFQYAQNSDAAAWIDIGAPLELVDGIKRDYRRGITGDEFFIGDAANNKQIRLLRLVRIGAVDGTDFEVAIDDFNVHTYEYADQENLHDYALPAILPFVNVPPFTLINVTTVLSSVNRPKGPAATVDGTSVLETAVVGEHGVSFPFVGKAGRTYTIRASVKNIVGLTNFGIVIDLGGGDEPYAVYNATTGPAAGTFEGNLGSGDAPLENEARVFNERNGYFRCELDVTIPSDGTYTVRLIKSTSLSGTFEFLGNIANNFAITEVFVEQKLKAQEESQTRLIPFSFNVNQNYVLALTEFNMSIFRSDTILPDDPTDLTQLGTVLTTFARSPYTNDQIPEINWIQSADTLIIFHQDVITQRVTRLGDTEWLIDDLPFGVLPTADLGDGNGDTEIWASNGRGWPQTGTFYQGRLWLGGATLTPNRFIGSLLGDFFTFFTGATGDIDPVDVTLDTDQINEILQLRGGRRLEIYTTGGEFVTNTGVLTPSSISVNLQSSIGIAKGIQPVNIDGATLFLGRELSESVTEAQTVWQFLFDFAEDAFRPSDVALLSQHLITQPIDMDAQAAKQSYIYVTNEDGTVAVFLTSRQQSIASWSRWTRRNGKYLNIASVQDGTVWAITRYTNLDGQDFTSLELFDENALLDNVPPGTFPLTVLNFGSINTMLWPSLVPTQFQRLALRVIRQITGGVSGVEDFESTSDPFTEIMAWTNSANLANGTPLTIAQVGFQIDVKVKTMPVNFIFPTGLTFGEFIRLVKVVLRFDNTQGIIINNRRVPNFASAITGFHEEYLDGWDIEAQVDISQIDPYPFTLLGANIEYEI